jgi:thioredoxin reductase
MHVSRMANRLADTVTIYTNGDSTVEATLRESLSQVKPTSKTARCISIEPRKIAKFVKGEKGSEIVVHFEDGERKVEAFITHKPVGVPNGGWIEMLGLETTPQGLIKVGAPFAETSVKGVFAAGDCAMPIQAATLTLGQAPLVAAGLVGQLEAED